MPQCMLCGKEISQYGVCASCQSARNPSVKQLKIDKTKCPECGSRYVKTIDGVHHCSMCGKEF